MHITALVEVASGRFIDRPTIEMTEPEYIRVDVHDNPDPIHQRYTGNPDAPFRDATPDEVSMVANARRSDASDVIFDDSIRLQALVTVLARKHDVTPEELRDEIKAEIKTLLFTGLE